MSEQTFIVERKDTFRVRADDEEQAKRLVEDESETDPRVEWLDGTTIVVGP